MKQVLLMVFFIASIQSSSGIGNIRAGARPLALSDAYVSISDIWSTFHNQAGIAGTDRLASGICYESRFFLKELSTIAGVVVLPTETGNFAFSFVQFGKTSYKEEKLSLAFAKTLGMKIKAGIQFDYFFLSLSENDRTKGFVTFEAGAIYSPSDKISFGAHVFNPSEGGIRFNEGKVKTQAVYSLGGSYHFNETLLTTIQAEKETGYPVCIRTGFEYQPAEVIVFRTGFSALPFRLTTGLGYKVGKLSADIGFSYINSLGITPSVSIQYNFR
jgi:hypothetical protein